MEIFITILIFCACFECGITSEQAVWKPKKLAMLALVPQNEAEVHGGIACQLAMQVAVDNVNNRSDILPNYHLEITYHDEGEDIFALKGNALKGFFQFLDNNTNSISSTVSPIVVGTVSPNGCDFIGAFAHLYNMIEIATACNLPIYTARRNKFPNLYRSTISDEMSLYPMVRFIRDVGNWSRVAIYSSSFVDYDYMMASEAYTVLSHEGIHVAWFNEFPAVDDDFTSLKAANVRVIVIFLVQPDILFATLCQWNAVGIRPDTGFVFLMRSKTVLEENGMFSFFKNICPRDILLSQLRSTFLIGSIEWPNNVRGSPPEVSSLGYGLDDFEKLLDNLVSQYTYTPSRFLRGYPLRTACHDTMLQAILTLDLADKSLASINLTISDYTVKPAMVATVVNQSAAMVNYTGIRGAGPKAYSERTEFDNEMQQIKQFFPGTFGLGTLLYTAHKLKPWPFNASSFVLKKYRSPTWVFSTKPGEPPNDSWGTTFSSVTAPLELSLFILAYSCTLIALQLLVACLTFWLWKFDTAKYQQLNRMLILLGCIVVNVAAIVFVQEGTQMCALRYGLIIVGLSLINGTIFFKLGVLYHPSIGRGSGQIMIRLRSISHTIAYGHGRHNNLNHYAPDHNRNHPDYTNQNQGSNICKPVDHIHSHHRITVGSNWSAHIASNHQMKRQQLELLDDPNVVKRRDHVSVYLALAFSSVNGAVLLGWFVSDPPQAIVASHTKEPIYLRATDTYVYEQVTACLSKSGNHAYWIYTLLALHGFILLVSLLLAYDLRRLKPNNKHLSTDLTQTRIAAINSTVLLIAVVLILFIFTSPLVQHEIMALSLLVDSTVLTIAVFLTGSQLTKTQIQLDPQADNELRT